MNIRNKIFFILLAFLPLLRQECFAQEQVAPLLYNPAVKKANNTYRSTLKTTALTLPFFEDFTTYNELPDSSRWEDHEVYINNTMGVNMISRGVATFDALSQYALPYDTSYSTVLRYADSLTCKPMDLSSYLPSDSVYLSFFYQPAGNGFAPELQDSLMLFFKSKTGGRWDKIWSTADSALRNFRQVMIPVADTNYLHSNFQFRFINKASIGINDDIWNLDYIRMDAGRNISDTMVNDVAYTLTPSNLLNDYTAIPYRQYLASPGAERGAKFQSTIQNNYTSTQNIPNFGYTARELSSGSSLSSGSDVNRSIPARNTSDIVFNTYSTTPSAGTYDKVVFENKYYLQSPGSDLHKENDTIVGQQIFDNYLAYDDGTAEMSYYLNLFPTLPGKIAVEHHLNQADTLRGVAIYFGRQVPMGSYKYFSLVVYKNITYGASTKDDIIYQEDNLQPRYVDTVNHFWIYKFGKPVAMPSGTFYIGTIQPALSGSDSLYIGLDRNRVSGNHVYFNVLNTWSPSLVSGALMIRPLLGQEIRGTSIDEISHKTFAHFMVAPNPAASSIQLSLPQADPGSNYEVLNLLGVKVLSGMMNTEKTTVDITALSSGMYLVHLLSEGKNYPVQKFVKQ